MRQECDFRTGSAWPWVYFSVAIANLLKLRDFDDHGLRHVERRGLGHRQWRPELDEAKLRGIAARGYLRDCLAKELLRTTNEVYGSGFMSILMRALPISESC